MAKILAVLSVGSGMMFFLSGDVMGGLFLILAGICIKIFFVPNQVVLVDPNVKRKHRTLETDEKNVLVTSLLILFIVAAMLIFFVVVTS